MIPLAVPNLAGNEARYLADCVETNFVSSVGPYVDKFESAVSDLTGSVGSVATSSGTTGLHLALTAIGVLPGDLVILPSLTFIASANAISHCGASPWLLDVSPESWTLDPDRLRRELESSTEVRNGQLVQRDTGRRVSAILAVYTMGMPADMDAIGATAGEFGLPVVADAAAALGARYRGRDLGGLARLSVASFNGNKTFTCGGGGAVFGMDQSLLAHARHLSTTARRGADYDHDAVGFNYRLTNLQASVGVAQLEQAPVFLARKAEIDRAYRAAAEAIPGMSGFPAPAWAASAYWLSGVLLPKGREVRDVVEGFRQRGVEARTFWKPIHLQEPYAQAPHGTLDVCEDLWRRIVTLPSSTSITDAEIEQVVGAIEDVLGS